MKPWVVVVGGFLGAGKTTLLLAAAEQLKQRGMRCALILNDQGDALVDTRLASLHHVERAEVTGGCFCCRFSDLLAVMDDLRGFAPDVIFAEPVGSCTDISATTLQPLRRLSDAYRLAPFTVLVDPDRARELLADSADRHMQFLFQKQLEEADILCLTKSDLDPAPIAIAGFNAQSVRQLSARTGSGVSEWLDEVLSGALSAGSRILEIDYTQYARAEAALAWLNLEVEIDLVTALSPPVVLGPILDDLDAELSAAGVSIIHLKAVITAPTGYVKAAICANGQEPSVEGDLDASPSTRHSLLINLRAVGPANDAQAIVERSVTGNAAQIDGNCLDLRLRCFHPAAPQPEHRYESVLGL